MFPPFLVLALPGLGEYFRRAGPMLEMALTMPALLLAGLDTYFLPELLLHSYKMGWP